MVVIVRSEKDKENMHYARMKDGVHNMTISHDMLMMTKEHVKKKIHKVTQKQMSGNK